MRVGWLLVEHYAFANGRKRHLLPIQRLNQEVLDTQLYFLNYKNFAAFALYCDTARYRI